MQVLTNQEFTYRQTPATEEGTGTFDSIKGNTLVWNQLIENGNFESTSGWKVGQSSLASLSASNNVLTYKISSVVTLAYNYRIQQQNDGNLSIPVGHKVLVSIDVNISKRLASNTGVLLQSGVGVLDRKVIRFDDVTLNAWVHRQTIYTIDNANQYIALYIGNQNIAVDDEFKFRNFMLIDLTQMGLDVTAQEFVSYFPLSYYPYDSGSLLSFNGSGIKTVGFNLFDEQFEQGNITNTGELTSATSNIRSVNYNSILPNTRYYLKVSSNVSLTSWFMAEYDGNKNFISRSVITNAEITTKSNTRFFKLMLYYANGNLTPSDVTECCLNKFDSGKNGTYEPYTESITTLPISTYFPSGMKSAGTVYDELTPSKTITRTKQVTYSSSTGWTTRTTGSGWRLYEIVPSDIKNVGTPQSERIKNNRFGWNTNLADNNTIRQVSATITVRKDDITSLSDWNTFLASNPLEVIYELATPTEADVDLDLTYPIEVGGTEEVLPSSLMNGSVDLGTLNYIKSGEMFYATVSGMTTSAQAKCIKYDYVGSFGNVSQAQNGTTNGQFGTSTVASYIFIHDSTFSDANSFKSAMSGVMLWYEKSDSEPTTTPIKADMTYRGLIPVSVNVYPLGSGTVTGSGQYRYKEEVTITATPNDEIYRFLRYEDENGNTLSTDPTYTFTVGE